MQRPRTSLSSMSSTKYVLSSSFTLNADSPKRVHEQPTESDDDGGLFRFLGPDDPAHHRHPPPRGRQPLEPGHVEARHQPERTRLGRKFSSDEGCRMREIADRREVCDGSRVHGQDRPRPGQQGGQQPSHVVHHAHRRGHRQIPSV